MPARYRSLFGQLATALDGWERSRPGRQGPEQRPIGAGQLLVANGNRGGDLLRPAAVEGGERSPLGDFVRGLLRAPAR